MALTTMILTAMIQATAANAIPEPLQDFTANSDQRAYKLFRTLNMPAVFIEYFNLSDERMQELFKEKKTRAFVVEKLTKGIIQYKNTYDTSLQCVLIDDGHGSAYAGAQNPHDKDRDEYWYASLFQEELLSAVEREGLIAEKIEYHEKGKQTARIKEHSQKANTFDCPGTKIYLATHIDKNKDKVNSYPHIHFSRPFNGLTKEYQKEITDKEEYNEKKEYNSLHQQSKDLAHSLEIQFK